MLEQLSFFPNPDLVIISPTIKRSGDVWINEDTAYVVTTKQHFIQPKGKISNLYYVGIHNGNSSYNFTAIESAVQNAIHYCIEEMPELKYRYISKNLMEVRYLVIDAIIIILCIFLIIYIKKYIKKE